MLYLKPQVSVSLDVPSLFSFIRDNSAFLAETLHEESISNFNYKSTEELRLIILMSEARFKEEMVFYLKNDEDLVNFDTSLKSGTLMG